MTTEQIETAAREAVPVTLAEDKVPEGRRYVIIMPCRDEDRFIENTLDTLRNQTILPVECIIVDDGSTDGTPDIADTAAEACPWIKVVHRKNRGERAVGGGVVEAFYDGLDALETSDYDYLCKLDADITLQPDYFESIMRKMEEDPKLGSASGKVFNPTRGTPFEEHIIDEQVSGAAKFYRRQCFEDIGGLVPAVMWDGIDFHRARMCGWRTRSFREDKLNIMHYRLMGPSHKNILHGRLRWGRGQWFMGTHPLYVFASGVRRMVERPWIIGGLCIIIGYYADMLKRRPRYDDMAFRKCLHRWQMKRLFLGWLCRKEESSPPDENNVHPSGA